jgi:RNA polymerase sigma-70 factor (ECF subfamily)
MSERDYLADRFEEHRTHLRGLAYRMLGSLSEVDDAVQEAWLRLSRTDAAAIENLGGWLTTVVARVCLDMLRSRQSRREEPLTADAPEPAAAGTRGGSSPEQEALLADSVGLALLVVLDRLTPAERLAFVLHDMFAMPFEEMGRSSAAPQKRQGSLRAGRDVASAAARCLTLISSDNVKSSTRSWPHCAPGISRACSPSSIRISSSARICPVRQARSAERPPGRRALWPTATSRG